MVKRKYWLNLIDSCFKKRNIIWLHGVRRIGKTFLCQSIKDVSYFDCEIPAVRREVEDENFLEYNKNKIIALDEIHRLHSPHQVLKLAADYYKKTKIIATGSSTLQAYKRFHDTLSGRKYDIWLTPTILSDLSDFKKANIKERLIKGGLPPFMLSSGDIKKDYSEWLDSFWAKDIQELFHLEKRYSFMKFIELLMENSSGIFNSVKYGNQCEVSRHTISSYCSILEMTNIISVIRPYSKHKAGEIVSAPKIYGFDTGFISFMKGWDSLRTEDCGHLWEHLVLNELQAVRQDRNILYWRDKAGHEIDFILLKSRQKPVTIECKWRMRKYDSRNLRVFRKKYPEGDNILITEDCRQIKNLTFNKLKVKVIGLNHISKLFAF